MSEKRMRKAKKSAFNIFMSKLSVGGGALLLTLLAFIFASCSSGGDDDTVYNVGEGTVSAGVWHCDDDPATGSSYFEDDTNNYYVYTATELEIWKASYSTSRNLVLMACIDMDGRESWEPLGGSSSPFSYNINGNGHGISNLSISSQNDGVGLVGYLDSNGTVENLVLYNPTISSSSQYTGGIVGYNNGTVDNCAVYASPTTGTTITSTSTTTRNGGLGGIVGYNDSTGSVLSCENYAEIAMDTSGVSYLGGIVGNNHGYIENCKNYGTVTSTVTGNVIYIGGIVGHNADSGEIKTSYNYADVTGETNGTVYAGGIAGFNSSGTIDSDSKSYGDVTGANANNNYNQ